MREDPIVADVRKAREKLLAAFEYDVDAYWEHLGQVERRRRENGFQYMETPLPKRTASAPDAA